MGNDGDKRLRSELDLRKYASANSKNVRSHDSSRDGVAKQQERPLDLSMKGQYSKYHRSWGQHSQEVESPLQEMRRLMGTLHVSQPGPGRSACQDTAEAYSQTTQAQKQSAHSN